MIEFRQILCPVDFSETSNGSLAHAAALARWYGAHLTVMHIVPTFDMPVHVVFGTPAQPMDPTSPEQVVAEMRRQLAHAIPSHATVTARSGDASTAIVEQAVKDRADLIVMGTHGRRGFKRLLLGSVTETVLREAPCPVLTVPPGVGAQGSEVVTFKRVLCAMDFSTSAMQALDFALDLARQADGTLTLLHVLEWLAEDSPRISTGIDIAQLRRSMVDEAEQQLHALLEAQAQTWFRGEHLVTSGRAHREIIRVAREKAAELIVMGAQGRGGVDLALFGSTTQQVVRNASCPVLTVRAASHA